MDNYKVGRNELISSIYFVIFKYPTKILNKINIDNFEQNFLNVKKNINLILNFMKSDKKNNSEDINLILLKDIGKPIININFKIEKIRKFFKNELLN